MFVHAAVHDKFEGGCERAESVGCGMMVPGVECSGKTASVHTLVHDSSQTRVLWDASVGSRQSGVSTEWVSTEWGLDRLAMFAAAADTAATPAAPPPSPRSIGLGACVENQGAHFLGACMALFRVSFLDAQRQRFRA